MDRARVRGLCRLHYDRVRRYGDALVPPRVRRDLSGLRFGTVLVLEDPSPGGGRTARCRCDCGRLVDLDRSGLKSGRTTTCGDRWVHRRRPVVTYEQAHKRVERVRGPAREHACVDCGRPAREWTYDHTDPAELVAERPSGAVAYSLDVERYSPRCVSCHRHVDMAYKAGRELVAPVGRPVQPGLFELVGDLGAGGGRGVGGVPAPGA